jgi:hypothetical protein
LTGDLRSTFDAVDGALVAGSRMFGSLIETAQNGKVPPAQSQTILNSVASGLSSLIEGRGDFVEAVKRMNAIKRGSNLNVVDLGCDNPLEVFTEASAPVRQQPVAVG